MELSPIPTDLFSKQIFLPRCLWALLWVLLWAMPDAKAQSPNLLLQSTSTAPAESKRTATDALGNIYNIGTFTGSVTFGTTTLVSEGSDDIFLAKYDANGAFQWARRAGGTSADMGLGVAVSGIEVYITGYFQSTANFNTPSATGSNEIYSTGNTDIFLAKYDGNGTLQWVTKAGGTDSDIAHSVAVSGSNVYITGYFKSTAYFNPTMAQLTSAGNSDIFLAQYDVNGAFQWAKRAGGTGFESGYGVAVSGSKVYITGDFSATANFNTPSATGSNEISSTGDSDIFLAQYDVNGALQWAKQMGGNNADAGNGVAVSGSNVYITGYFHNTATFNTLSATGSTNQLVSAGNSDIFLAKYDENGVFKWSQRAGGTAFESGYGVAALGNSVYITGFFAGTANFNTPSSPGNNQIISAGSYDIFLAKYDANGVFQWTTRAGGTGYDAGRDVGVSGNSVYITGNFAGTANFNTPSAPGSNQLVTSSSNGFIARYASRPFPVGLPTCLEDDFRQLEALYDATNGANWSNQTNWFTAFDMSTWAGINLTMDGCDVEIIYLNNSQLSGSIPNLNFPKLRSLDLASNSLTGSIPNFNFPYLEYLYLRHNQLSGNIPNFNLPNLKNLVLYDNQLSGNIPNFNLPNLVELLSETNQLIGSIPNFNLPNLRHLSLSNNQLTGSIPSLNLPTLLELRLMQNQLSGCIPRALKINCPQIGWQSGHISGNPNLATQDWAGYWNNNTGACALSNCEVTTTQTRTIRQGTSVIVNGRTYNTSGIYRDTIFRAGLCDSIIVTNLTVITCNVTVSIGTNGNTLTANALGGQGGYTFLWNNQATTETLNNAVIGTTYQVTVTDILGCTATATLVLAAPTQSLYQLQVTGVECGSTQGTLHVNMNATRTCIDALTLKVQFDTTKIFFENNRTIQNGTAIPASGVVLRHFNRDTLVITVDLDAGCIQGTSGTNVLNIPFRLRPSFAALNANSLFRVAVLEERVSTGAIQDNTTQTFQIVPTLVGNVSVLRPNGAAVKGTTFPMTLLVGDNCNGLTRTIAADTNSKAIVRLDSFRFVQFNRPALPAVASPLIGGFDVFLVRAYWHGDTVLTARQKIAADVNNDGVITPLDVTILRRRAIGIYTNFADYSGGRLTSDYQFTVSTNPDTPKVCFALPARSTMCDTPSIQVTMITLGDLNGDTDTNPSGRIERDAEPIAKMNSKVILNLHRATRVADEWKIPVYANQVTRGLDLQLLNLNLNPNVFRVSAVNANFDVLGNGNGANYYIVGNANALQGIAAHDTLFYLYMKTALKECQQLGQLKGYLDAQLIGTDCLSAATGLTDVETNGFEMYPNPTEGNVQMTIQQPLSNPTTLRIYDMLGRCVRTTVLQPGNRDFTIDISDLGKGVYQFQFENQSKKVVKY